MPSDDSKYHDEREVGVALPELVATEKGRLEAIARSRFGVEPDQVRYGHTWEDLLQEAIQLTLGGQRSWRRGVELIYHLDQTMRSIASNWALRSGKELPLEPKLVDLVGSEQPDMAHSMFVQQVLEEVRGQLSPRERRVFRLAALGYSSREIAGKLGISRTIVDRELVTLQSHLSYGVRLQPQEGGDPDTSTSPRILSQVIQVCNQELLTWLSKHPEDLYRLHPGTFEQIVAEIFRGEGFEVEAISSWNQADGGVDLLAVRKINPILDLRLAIQCKRHQRHQRVSADPIRSLVGVLDRFRAHAGVLSTTSYFTTDAKEETRRYLWRIALQDYDFIVEALQRLGVYNRSSGGLWLPKSPAQE